MTTISPLTTKANPSAEEKKKLEEKYLLADGIKSLKPDEKIEYYKKLAKHMGLDPITKPFGVWDFQGREDLYIKATAFDQVCSREKVSRKILQQEVETSNGQIIKKDFVVVGENKDQLYLVKVEASRMIDGERVVVEDIAMVPVWYEKTRWTGSGNNRQKTTAGWALDENALMKSMTKAYRRAAQKLVSIPVTLEDDARGDGGELKELNLETGTEVGGTGVGDPLDVAFPQPWYGAKTIKELEREKGIESLLPLQAKLKASKDEGKISEQWAAILAVLDKHLEEKK